MMKNKFEREFGGDAGYDPYFQTLRIFDFHGLEVKEIKKSQAVTTSHKTGDTQTNTWIYPAVVSIIFLAHQSQIRDEKFIWMDEKELLAAIPFADKSSLLSINLSEGEVLPENWKNLIDFSQWKQGNLFEEWNAPQEIKLKKSETLLRAVGLKVDQILFSKVYFEAWNGKVCVKFGKKSVDKGFLHLRNYGSLNTYLYFDNEEDLKNFVISLNSDSLKQFFFLFEEYEDAYREMDRLNRWDKKKDPAREKVKSLKEKIESFWKT